MEDRWCYIAAGGQRILFPTISKHGEPCVYLCVRKMCTLALLRKKYCFFTSLFSDELTVPRTVRYCWWMYRRKVLFLGVYLVPVDASILFTSMRWSSMICLLSSAHTTDSSSRRWTWIAFLYSGERRTRVGWHRPLDFLLQSDWIICCYWWIGRLQKRLL